MITITFNGKQETIDAAIPLSELVTKHNLNISKVAIEKNGTIIQRKQYANSMIADGDIIECFEFVGGG